MFLRISGELTGTARELGAVHSCGTCPGQRPEPLQTWLAEQHAHGLSIRLVRLSEFEREPDLVLDMGIYGNRAVGVQEQDDQGRTVRFTLSFDFPEVLAAEQRWERLLLLATSFGQILDQTARCT